MPDQTSAPASLPADDLSRHLTLTQPEANDAVHLGIVGDTYTILLTGEQTDGRFCLIDMYVPQNGGPGPHRHDFEETFTVLEGEIEVTFRGQRKTIKAGNTVNIPANAPHAFHNNAASSARMLCLCAPAGNERFFMEIGVPVPTRTSPPPRPTEESMEAFQQKAAALAPKYRSELLPSA